MVQIVHLRPGGMGGGLGAERAARQLRETVRWLAADAGILYKLVIYPEDIAVRAIRQDERMLRAGLLVDNDRIGRGGVKRLGNFFKEYKSEMPDFFI